MFKRISIVIALAVFVAASGMFLVMARTEPGDVKNRVENAARNNASFDNAGKEAIDLGEIVILARDASVK